MRGVCKVNGRDLWEVSYVNRKKVGRLRKFVRTEEEGIKLRKQWEERYGAYKPGVRKGTIRKDRRGKHINNFFVIDYYPESNTNVLVKNEITNKTKVMRLDGIISGNSTGIPLCIAGLLNKKGNLIGVRYRKNISKWEAHISIKGKYQSLGCFSTKQEAIKVRKDIEKKCLNGEKIPKFKKRKTNTGKKYISELKNRKKKFFLSMKVNSKYYKMYFYTLSEAIIYRNQFLKEHNLPIPD